MLQGIVHVRLTVTDLDRSVAFYRDVLGLAYLGEMEMEGLETEQLFQRKGCKARVAYLNGSRELAAPPVELIQFVGQEPERQSGDLFRTSISELCFAVEDIDREYRRLKEMGVEFLSEPQTFDSRIWIWQEPGSLSTRSGGDGGGPVAHFLKGTA